MKAVVRNRADLEKWVNRCCEHMQQDKPYTVTIRPFIRPRTLDQNSKFHAMCADLAEHVGTNQKNIKAIVSPGDIKEYVKSECGWVKTVEIGDKIKELPMPTSEMNVEQLSHLIEELYRIGSECGCVFQESE